MQQLAPARWTTAAWRPIVQGAVRTAGPHAWSARMATILWMADARLVRCKIVKAVQRKWINVISVNQTTHGMRLLGPVHVARPRQNACLVPLPTHQNVTLARPGSKRIGLLVFVRLAQHQIASLAARMLASAVLVTPASFSILKTVIVEPPSPRHSMANVPAWLRRSNLFRLAIVANATIG